jgi:hypothetical protein
LTIPWKKSPCEYGENVNTEKKAVKRQKTDKLLPDSPEIVDYFDSSGYQAIGFPENH